MRVWPRQSECTRFFGNPRSSVHADQADASWERNNLTRIVPPFAMRFGVARASSIRVHKLCADPFLQWLNHVKANAKGDPHVLHLWGMDAFSGAYVFRLMRGLNHLSMHAYGCAIDLDAGRNALGSHNPHFAAFKVQVVSPFLDLGGTWGGDWNGNGSSADEARADGMHFQFAHMG
jgi:hypothetical protein